MRIRIHGGTANSGENLCLNCRQGQTVQGHAVSQAFTMCGAGMTPKEIKFPVASCTSFRDRNAIPLSLMEDIAWELKTSKGRQLGFSAPSDKKKESSYGGEFDHIVDD